MFVVQLENSSIFQELFPGSEPMYVKHGKTLDQWAIATALQYCRETNPRSKTHYSDMEHYLSRVSDTLTTNINEAKLFKSRGAATSSGALGGIPYRTLKVKVCVEIED